MTRLDLAHDRTVSSIQAAFAEVGALDPHEIARRGALQSLRAKALGPLSSIIEQVLEWLIDIEIAFGDVELASGNGPGYASGGRASDGELDFDGWVLADDSEPRQRPPAGVADVCFAARCDLTAELRRLESAAPTPEALTQRCEAAASRVRRALQAVLDAMAVASVSLSPPIETVERCDVELAVAVRASFARLRGAVLPVDPEDPASVADAIEALSRALQSVLVAPEFRFVRADDQRLLREVSAAAVGWLAGPRDPVRGAWLYRDIVATADGLRAINSRHELVAHDSAVVGEARAVLAAPEAPLSQDDFDSLVDRLWSLRGRDDAFDSLLGRAIAGEAAPRLARLFASRLDILARKLGIAGAGARA